MTYQDYLDCALQYREQADKLDSIIKENSKPRRFKTAEERSENERSGRILYAMKLECLKTMVVLEQRGKEIRKQELREREAHEKNNLFA